MGKPADRDVNYMKKMWGTESLITDYWSLPRNDQVDPEERMLSEVMHDDLNQNIRYPKIECQDLVVVLADLMILLKDGIKL